MTCIPKVISTRRSCSHTGALGWWLASKRLSEEKLASYSCSGCLREQLSHQPAASAAWRNAGQALRSAARNKSWQVVLKGAFFVPTSTCSVVLVSEGAFCGQTWVQLAFILWTPRVQVFYSLRLLQKNLERMDTWFFTYSYSPEKILYLTSACRHIRSIGDPAHVWRKRKKFDNSSLGFFNSESVWATTVHFWELRARFGTKVLINWRAMVGKRSMFQGSAGSCGLPS